MDWMRQHCDLVVLNMTGISGLITLGLIMVHVLTDTPPMY